MKRRLSIFLILILIIQAVFISPKGVKADTAVTKLPTNSVVIGDKIYSSAYMNTYLNEVNQQIQKYPNSMYFIDTSGNIKNMITGDTASEDQLVNLTSRLLTYYCLTSESDSSKGWTYGAIFIADSNGNYQPVLQNTYPKYGYAIANVNASDSTNASYKLLTISINNINGVTDAYYYIIDDKPINNDNSYVKRRIYETAVIITPKTTKTLYVNIYSSSDSSTSLIGSGSIPISNSSDIANGTYSIPFLLKLENTGIGSIADRITGNISNNGIASYEDGFIYYSNYSDKGKIYKKSVDGLDDYPISEDNAKFINVQNGWVYYSNYSDGGKIYRVKTDGTSRQKLNNAMSSYINVVGDYVYYVNNSDKGRIYKLNYLVNSGGLFLTNGQPLTNERVTYLVVDVLRNLIYFSNYTDKSKLYSITTDGLYKKALSTVGVRFLSVLSDGTLYCSGVDGKLYKYNPYGSIKFFPINITTNVESKTKNSTVTKPYTEKFTVLNVITSNDIYYRSNVDGGKIYKANSSGNGTKIIDDSADAINVVGNTIYYTKSGKLYKYNLSNSDKKAESVAKIKYFQKISSINPIDPVDVSDVNSINFPEMVSAIMSDGSLQDLVVNWDVSKPSAKNGTYTYKGKVVGYGNAVTFQARINSDKINPNNVNITNNEGNNADTIEIAGLIKGDVVNIYDPNDTTKPIKKATVGNDGKVTISKLSLNQGGGTLGVTVTRKGKAESQMVFVTYLAEVPTITSIAYDESNKAYTVTYKGTSSKVDYYINSAKISTVDAGITPTSGVFSFNIPLSSITDVSKNNTVEISYNNTTNKSRSYTLLSQNAPNVTYDVISGTFSGLDSSIEVAIDGTNYIPYSDLISNNLAGKNYIMARYKANQNKLPGNPSYVLLVGAPTVKIASVDGGIENIAFDTNNPLTYTSDGNVIEAKTTVKEAKAYFENIPATGSGIEFTAQYTKDGKTYKNINSGESISESGVYTLKLILKVNGNIASSNARDIRFKVFNSAIQKPEIYIAGVTGKEETASDNNKLITAYDPRPTLTNYTDLSLNIGATIERSTDGTINNFGAPLQYSMVGGTGAPIDKEGLYRIKVKYYKTSTSPQIESDETVIYVKVDKKKLPDITLKDNNNNSVDDSLGALLYSSSTGLIIDRIDSSEPNNIAWVKDDTKKVDNKRYTLLIKYHKIGDTEWKVYDPDNKLPINQAGNYELKLVVKDWESGFTSDMDSSYKNIINFSIQ
ncbi:Ig-like domain (group 4) [Caloramator quimbayensis]|uniref:Ig-like domain (Group 4) n=1 Tax=Caloramator quimbayensis TaxID=1147123 RepID=A0A1T4XA40_9CLOT|nr:DUF5050 domain-containing protein [Caloramator quimbayensis]SKA86277.1 Ig-like domain (group 4) [Caloramator quimbayensis]